MSHSFVILFVHSYTDKPFGEFHSYTEKFLFIVFSLVHKLVSTLLPPSNMDNVISET